MRILIAPDSFKGTMTSSEVCRVVATEIKELRPDAEVVRLPVADGGEGSVASWLNTVAVRSVHPNTIVAFRVNNISGAAADMKLYAYGADGKLQQLAPELWTITDENGQAVETLEDGALYELRVTVTDGGAFDLDETERTIKVSVALGK